MKRDLEPLRTNRLIARNTSESGFVMPLLWIALICGGGAGCGENAAKDPKPDPERRNPTNNNSFFEDDERHSEENDGSTEESIESSSDINPIILQNSTRFSQIELGLHFALGLRADTGTLELFLDHAGAAYQQDTLGPELRDAQVTQFVVDHFSLRACAIRENDARIVCANISRESTDSPSCSSPECNAPSVAFSSLTYGCGIREDTRNVMCWESSGLERLTVDELSMYSNDQAGCAAVVTNPDDYIEDWELIVHCWEAGSPPEPARFAALSGQCGLLEDSQDLRCWFNGANDYDAEDLTLNWHRRFPSGPYTKLWQQHAITGVGHPNGPACALRADTGAIVCGDIGEAGSKPPPPSGSYIDFSPNRCGVTAEGSIVCPLADGEVETIEAPGVRFKSFHEGPGKRGALTEDGHLVVVCPGCTAEEVSDRGHACFERDANGDYLCTLMNEEGEIFPHHRNPSHWPGEEGGNDGSADPDEPESSGSIKGSCIVRNVVEDPNITPGCTDYYEVDSTLIAQCDDSLLTAWNDVACPDNTRWDAHCWGATVDEKLQDNHIHPDSQCGSGAAGNFLQARCEERGGRFSGCDCGGSCR